jgi:hypothetical protein
MPGFLPENCGAATNVGTGNLAKETMLLNCGTVAIGDKSCEWYVAPARPRTRAAARQQRRFGAEARRLIAVRRLSAPACSIVGDTLSCAAFANRP